MQSFVFRALHVFWIVCAIIVDASEDFTLACKPGHRVTAIRRSNSAHQRGKAGSLSVECQPIMQLPNTTAIKCDKLASTPQCNGWPEGCKEQQWLAGFHAYGIENSTNVAILDPICCESPKVIIDALSCATERLNEPRKEFEHMILPTDLVYRGLQCWHQYNAVNTVVDLVWKLEICQYSVINTPAKDSQLLETKTHNSKSTKNTFTALDSCPACNCSHCGIDVCRDGKEPVRVIHKLFPDPNKCSCHCTCTYQCI